MQTVLIHKCMCVGVTNQLYGGALKCSRYIMFFVLVNLHFEIVDEILFCSVISPDTQ